MIELLGMDEPRRRIAAMLCALDVHYYLGEEQRLLGRRMPNLDLVTADGPLRVFTLLHDARPVLLNLDDLGITPWAHRVLAFDAEYAGGAGGFCSATVRRLAQKGAKVVIADVSDERGVEALARG
jgi:3-(3-hydroxy-phenyl)propionate hydroxylase